MLLLSLIMLVLLLGGTALVVTMRAPQSIQGLISGAALFVAIFGLLWITALMLPQVVSWVATGIGTFLLVLASRVWAAQRTGLLPAAFGLAVAALAFHFSLALLDEAMSTRTFDSDQALVIAALKRGVSLASLSQLAPLLVLIALGALAGQLVGSTLRRRRYSN